MNSDCSALDNFWRSLSNLTVDFPAAPNGAPCQQTAEFWAASQASPLRRVVFHGLTSLEDYCSKPGYSSGGFIADSEFTGRPVVNGSQQQFLVRNSTLDGWSNDVWNQVFSGDEGAPAQDFGSGGQYTTLAASPVSADAPFLRVDASGGYSVFVPAARHHSVGPSWAGGQEAGRSVGTGDFFIARPGDPATAINAALARGQDLLLTPGVYHLSQSIEVTRPTRARCRTCSSASAARPPGRPLPASRSTAPRSSWTTSGPGGPTTETGSAGPATSATPGSTSPGLT
jgi:hypothetical protein